MEFITVEAYKAFENLKSPDQDVQITDIIAGVNSLVSNILDAEDILEYKEKTDKTLYFFLNTEALAADITVKDSDGNPLSGLTGASGRYTLTNEYVGWVTIEAASRFTTVPYDLGMACMYLARYYRSSEYKANMSGAGQSVTFVSLDSNIPRHVMSVLSLYRPL